MLGILKMCYTCLGTNSKELIDVTKMDCDNVSFICKLRACVSPELEENSSKQICSTCIKQLRISYRFREMVLHSQETLDKHKNEIISGTYRTESNLNEPECLVVVNTNSTVTRRLRSTKTIEDGEDNCSTEIPVDINENDSDSCSDSLLADLRNENMISEQNNGNNNIEYLTENAKLDEEQINQYQCANCNTILEGPNAECHSCDVYDDSCDDSDAKEETRQNSKEIKTKKGRPKKKMKNPKPEMDYECYHCSMIFNKRWKLQKHISRVHSDSKKYICTYCNKGFKQSYHLREHLTSHTGERNYTCSFCDKSFQRISSMRRHIRSHEAAPGHKTKRTPFLCTVCGKSFPFSNGVQRHMRIHLGIKNHECTICQRRFTQSTHLHVHMRTHTGEKPYVCDTCGEPFSLNASLQKHMTIHQDNIGDDNNKIDLLVCKKMELENL